MSKGLGLGRGGGGREGGLTIANWSASTFSKLLCCKVYLSSCKDAIARRIVSCDERSESRKGLERWVKEEQSDEWKVVRYVRRQHNAFSVASLVASLLVQSQLSKIRSSLRSSHPLLLTPPHLCPLLSDRALEGNFLPLSIFDFTINLVPLPDGLDEGRKGVGEDSVKGGGRPWSCS